MSWLLVPVIVNNFVRTMVVVWRKWCKGKGRKNDFGTNRDGTSMRERVVNLIDARSRRGDWTSEDLAQLHRAASALRHPGLSLEVDGGVTDEGEPWFAVCHAQSGEVAAHFARIDGSYIVCAPFLKSSLRGRVLCELIGRFLDCCRAMGGPGADDDVRHLSTGRR